MVLAGVGHPFDDLAEGTHPVGEDFNGLGWNRRVIHSLQHERWDNCRDPSRRVPLEDRFD